MGLTIPSQIQQVFSDIDGMSAQAIINAILAGERDPKKLAALRDKRCHGSAEDIIEALCGDYRKEYLFVLAQCQKTYLHLRESIAAIDEEHGELAAGVECEVSSPLPEVPNSTNPSLTKPTTAPKPSASSHKNRPIISNEPIALRYACGVHRYG